MERQVYRVHSTLSQVNSDDILANYLFTINFNIVFPPTTISPKWSLPLRFTD